jgi:hypothetical protein
MWRAGYDVVFPAAWPGRGMPGWPWRGRRRPTGVEVEHLRTGEFPLTHAVKAENLAVQALSGRRQAALAPQHDDLLAGRGDYPRIQPPERGGGLQPVPVRGPALAAAGQPTDGAAVGKRRRPAELDIWHAGPGQGRVITLLDRGEHGHYRIDARCASGQHLSPSARLHLPCRGRRRKPSLWQAC